VIAGIGLPLSVVVGLLMARNVGAGIGTTLALVYTPIALLTLPVAIALWVPIAFIALLPFVWVGPTAASAVIFIAWLGTLRSGAAQRTNTLRAHAWLLGAMALYVVWATLSLLWAVDSGRAAANLYVWYVAALVLAIIMTTIVTPGQVRMIMVAVVVGGVLSVTAGLLAGSLSPTQSALSSAAEVQGRLAGGSGDPNYLAAGLVPAIVIAAALMTSTRNPLLRFVLLMSMVVMGVGLAETQSRGGLLAGVVAVVGSLIIFKRHRGRVAMALAVVVAVAGVFFATTPGAWQRVTSLDGGGSGRSDLWKVAGRIAGSHPITGVGLDNFTFQEKHFVQRPGQLTSVDLIVEKPHVVHSVYLQALAELGIVGLVLLVTVMLGCVGATGRAIRRFDARGQPELATLARALLIAQLAILVAQIFLSDGDDQRFWLVFALGPVMASLASRAESMTARVSRPGAQRSAITLIPSAR
jgi:O-antigen ligase